MSINRRTALVSGLALGASACSPRKSDNTASAPPKNSIPTKQHARLSDLLPHYSDLTAQVEYVRAGEVNPAELVEEAINRIERFNPALNAVVTPCFDRAREKLSKLPANTVTGGVPILIKDLMDVQGVRSTYGSGAFKNYIPQVSDVYVDRAEAAGMIVLGKTNTPELGLLPITEPLAYGASKNPWDLTRTTGGSSGGTASAVAGGIMPCAQGSDGGGSIRIPSHYCGLFGLKPSRHRVVDQYNRAFSISVAGALSKTVRDSALMLSLTETSDDKRSFPSVGLVTDPIDRKLKIGLAMDDYFAGTVIADADVKAAIEKTAKLCESLGHDVEVASPPRLGQDIIDAFMILWGSIPHSVIKNVEGMKRRKVTDEEFEPWTQMMAQQYVDFGGEKALVEATQKLKQAERKIVAFIQSYDAVLSPVMPSAAHKLGKYDTASRSAYAQGMLTASASVGYTAAYNVAGAPCMSVPLFRSPQGLPIGSQFISAPGGDGLLLRLALQLEAAQPWIDHYPTL